MNLISTTRNKAAVSALLAVIIGLIVLNNFKQQSNSASINKSIATIYDDRLVVEGYIFNYSQHLENINKAATAKISDTETLIKAELTDIKKINSLYLKTKLTEDEQLSFDKFLSFYKNLENSFDNGDLNSVIYYSDKAQNILPVLSDIQMKEATSEMDNLKRLFGSSSMSSKFETGVLVIITLLILALQFAHDTVKPIHFPKNPGLN